MMQKNQVSDDVRSVFRRLIRYWKLYPVMLFIFGGISFLYIKTKPPVHEIESKLVVHENNRDFLNPSSFVAGSELFAGRNSFENSLLTIQASPIILEAVSKFSSRIEYYRVKSFFTEDLYRSSPINVVIDAGNLQLVGIPMEVEVLSADQFRLKISKTDARVYHFLNERFVDELTDFSFSEVYEFGEPVVNDYFKFTVFLENEENIDQIKEDVYQFVIRTDGQLVNSFKSRLELERGNIDGTVINLKFRTKNTQKGMDFLQSFLETVIDNNLERKNHIANSTINYIDSLLASVSDSLRQAERTLQQYQSVRDVMDVSQSAERLHNELSRIQEQKSEYESRVDYLTYLSNQMRQDDSYTEYSMSAVMALNNNSLSILMEEYIDLVRQRTRLVENEQTKSPLLNQVESRISNLRRTIRENVRYALNIAQQDLDKAESRMAALQAQIRQLPETQRNLQTFRRDFRLNDDTYTYLMEKKAEAQIARAANLPDYEVFDPPTYGMLVSPRSKRVMGFAIFLSLFFATVLALLYDNFFGKISSSKDLESLENGQFLGDLFHTGSPKKMVEDKQFSAAAESVRALRSRVLALSQNETPNDETSKIILVTSSVQGEGKTFISYHLAHSMAKLKKSTLLVELDLRKPRVVKNYEPQLESKFGLVDYIDGKAELGAVISSMPGNELFIIPSGGTPPNPSEILNSDKFRNMLDEAKKHFDYIILDSAPLIVSDTRGTLPLADIILMVSRSGYSPLRSFKNTMASLNDFRKGKVGVVLNDVKMGIGRKYYNYKYGYKN